MDDARLFDALCLLDEYEDAVTAGYDRLLKLAGELRAFVGESVYKPAYNGGLLDVIGGAGETLMSRIIANILGYADSGGRLVWLESFVKRFVGERLVLKRPVITVETDRMDVAVKDAGFAIVIENKLRNAVYQRNQPARYVARLKERYGYDEKDIYFVVLPQLADAQARVSAWRLPPDWYKNNADRMCRVGAHECWCDDRLRRLDADEAAWCAGCDRALGDRLKPHRVTLHDEFAEWLVSEGDALPAEQWPLRSCMQQFAYYLKGLYFTRNDMRMSMAINDFLRERMLSGGCADENWRAIDDAIGDLDQLRSALNNLRMTVAKEYVGEWAKELDVSLHVDGKIVSFGLNIKGVWVGCWAGDNREYNYQPYWGFFCHTVPTDEQYEMVRKIVARCEKEIEVGRNRGFMCWDNTLHGAHRCREFYQAARQMGYLDADVR